MIPVVDLKAQYESVKPDIIRAVTQVLDSGAYVLGPEVAANETDMAFLAFEQSRAVGSLAFYLEEEKDDNMTVPPRCRYMTLAATVKSMRGRGIGTALAWYGLRAVRAAGADYCLTNWQSANLLAARLWPRFGFKPIEVRLGRTINPMIAWAKG